MLAPASSCERTASESTPRIHALVPRRLQCTPLCVDLAAQLLGHQDAAQVTLARAAWPLRLGWKKSRVLTWLALNW